MRSLQPPEISVPAGSRPAGSRNSTVGFIAVQMAFLAAAHALGGPPWVGLGVLAFLGQIMADFRLASLARLTPALVWAGAHALTGNRELFFPYAVYLAAHLAVEFMSFGFARAAVAAGGMMMVFLLIRIAQRATLSVLAVELAVTSAILAAALVVIQQGRDRPEMRWLIPAVASFAAYAGLAV